MFCPASVLTDGPVSNAVGNTCGAKTVGWFLRRSKALLLSESAICCFIFFFFLLWIRANQGVQDGWTPSWGFISFCASSRILKLSAWHSWVCSLPHLSQYRTSWHRWNERKSQTCFHAHMCVSVVGGAHSFLFFQQWVGRGSRPVRHLFAHLPRRDDNYPDDL